MRLPKETLLRLRVNPGEPARLKDRPTRASVDLLGKAARKGGTERTLDSLKAELDARQLLLYASGTWALLLIFQGLDAAGKDGTIRHVMSGLNPQGCRVATFGRPSEEELRHDFLWRCVKELPRRGQIGIFNRSYYEEVLVVRVHPQLLAAQRLPGGEAGRRRRFRQRYEDINCFERHLEREGTRVVKFFLHVSFEEQRRRLLARLDEEEKRWKFSPSDLEERSYFAEYRGAYEDALSATSSEHSPWFVIPADDKPLMRALVAGVVVDVVDRLALSLPPVGPEQEELIEKARRRLESEAG